MKQNTEKSNTLKIHTDAIRFSVGDGSGLYEAGMQQYKTGKNKFAYINGKDYDKNTLVAKRAFGESKQTDAHPNEITNTQIKIGLTQEFLRNPEH